MSAWPSDPLAAVVHAHPYPYYQDLARRRPLYFDAGLGLWVAAGHAAAQAVLASAACRVRPLEQTAPPPLGDGGLARTFCLWARMSEAPRHPALKAALNHALATVAGAEAGRLAESLARDWLAREPLSGGLLDRMAQGLPVLTLAGLLGLEVEDAPALVAEVAALAQALAADADAKALARGEAALEALRARVGAALPRAGGLLAALRHALEPDEAALTANVIGLLFQSLDAGAGLFAAAVWHQAQGRPLEAGAAAEWAWLALHDPVLHNTRRFAAGDWRHGGQTVPAGASILVVLAAAALDPAGPGEALMFGAGRHACPGQALAMEIARGGLAALAAARPDWQVLTAAAHFRRLPNARVRIYGDKGRTE
ncbi:cytochrome P450 [Chromobacterium alkanivorans]|uniref:hypothetical protein n=1 Tax=Chromobacterium alkanivorans TaxID=1071719 RepID=UPI0021677A3D|nr:hypothetical protein [Chromobacterium alkanivorans]MCS3805805.1 cytochrome P450 [Chromobacterium alkanivorans]MCS3819965.1 cytochrome P450 [Chromobacterium alkanivorans]MCS3874722.1 cytochrome P450 [Chromobacterium alkanivorans]